MAEPSGSGQVLPPGHRPAQLFQMFPDDAAAEEGFIANRWPEGLPRAIPRQVGTPSWV